MVSARKREKEDPFFRRHHKCNGTGMGSKPTAGCKGCGATGSAESAFVKQSRRENLMEWILRETQEDASVQQLIEIYCTAIYGKANRATEFYDDENEKRGAQVCAVFEHALDRHALMSVVRLGDPSAVFKWLVVQEQELLKDLKPEDFRW